MTVSGQTTSFQYDGDGNLVKKTNPNGSRTIYVGGVYEVEKTSGGTVTGTTTYYPAGGAIRVNGTLYFVLKDHLGSASVVTDASGVIVGENRYFPYGETRFTTGTMYTDKLYTGQREMTGLGIYHYQARFYSPRLGRFLSADTIVPNPANPQDLNRFSYVRNNPVRYVDPSGHAVTTGDYGGCGKPNCGLPLPPPPCSTCGGGGGGGGGGNNNPSPSDGDLGLPPAPVMVANPDPLDLGLLQNAPTLGTDLGTPDPSTTVAGVVLLTALFFFVDLPIIIGLIAFFPELEFGMLVTEVWIYPLALALVDAHIYAVNLIIEGNTGEKDHYDYLLVPNKP